MTSTFGARLLGALTLTPETYEDVEHDRSSLPQALTVVVASSIATGIGSMSSASGAGVLSGVAFALIGWVVWAALVFAIGTRLFPEPQTEADVGELMRTTGFAAAPGLFGMLGAMPGVGPVLMFGVSIWMMLAMLIAVRQALDFTSTWRALGVVAMGWVSYLAMLVLATSV